MTQEFEIIDAHVHLYRGVELEKKNVQHPGRRDRDRWGNPETVLSFMDQQGIAKVVCLPNFPTRQLRQSLLDARTKGGAGTETEAIEADLRDKLRRQNEWLARVARENPRLVAAISMQLLFSPEEMVAEVHQRAGEGAKLVKMLPGFYHEYPQDRAFWPMYDACQELGLAIVSDTGTLGLAETGIAYGEPVNFTEVLENFPRLNLVMAHFPSAFWDQRVDLARRFPNVYFDTSGSFNQHHIEVRDGHRAAALEDAVRLMRAVGLDRFMFGTDGPRFLFQPELEQILGLSLTDAEKQLVLADNAKRIYQI